MPDLQCPRCQARPERENDRVCTGCGDRVFLSPEGIAAADADPNLGRLLDGRFGLLRAIAEGGMGAIYEGIQLPVERRVAVKLIRPEALGSNREGVVERFRREARAISRLKHPHTVTLYDFGATADGRLFIAMELVEGPPLDALLKSGPLPVDRALRLTCQIAQTLDYAHNRGVIHRDLKPANVMLATMGEVGDFAKVVDFGIARLTDVEPSSTNVTLTGKFSGTPHYMSPEQVRGQPADERSDIYSLGLMLYEMIAGHAPFRGGTAFNLAIKQLHDYPKPLHEIPEVQELPSGLQPCIDRAINKAPEERYQRAVDFQRALEAFARRRDLGALWASAGDDREAVFSVLRRHFDRFIQLVIEEIRSTLSTYRHENIANLRKRVSFFVDWATQLDPSEEKLIEFLDRAWSGRFGVTVRLPMLMSAFACAFPSLRELAQEIGEDERAMLERHWPTLERHFWHTMRVVGACYEDTLLDRARETRITDTILTRDPYPDHAAAGDAHDTRADTAPQDYSQPVIQGMASGLLVIDRAKRTIEAINPAMARQLEMEPEELLGRHILDALRPIRGVDLAGLINQIREHGELTPTKVRIRTARGNRRWLQFRGAYFQDDLGQRTGVYVLCDDVTEREMIVDSFRRYVGPEVVEDLLLTRRGIQLRGEHRKVTVMFIGLQGEAGPSSEPEVVLAVPPRRAVASINRYYGTVVEAVTGNRGLVDSLVKHTVMAIFGAPFAHDDDAASAVKAAQDILTGVGELNEDYPDDPPLRLGIGVATGTAVVGNIGSTERVSYTAVGEVVYQADRLRMAACHGDILIDDQTRQETASTVHCTPRAIERQTAFRVVAAV